VSLSVAVSMVRRPTGSDLDRHSWAVSGGCWSERFGCHPPHRPDGLVNEGRSNPEIAQTLFVTRKTVETHLGSICHDLDIPGRGGLARALGVRVTPTDG
jgi:regulatory LuxR family protein